MIFLTTFSRLRRDRPRSRWVALLAAGLSGACARDTSSTPLETDGGATTLRSVRVPAALSIARGLDTLSVGVDPASLALTQVTVDRGMTVGVERDAQVSPVGQTRSNGHRHGVEPSDDFNVRTDTWNTREDGIPVPGTLYVAEVAFVLFETDVPPSQGWNPHAGNYKALWTRTLRQAEE